MSNKLTLNTRLKLHLMIFMLKHHDRIFKQRRFDLGGWGLKGKHALYAKEPDEPQKNLCNTSGCACGSASLWWPFRLLGLKGAFTGNKDLGTLSFEYKGEGSWYAVRLFFGIDRTTANFLFYDGDYRKEKTVGKEGRKAVIKHIRHILNGGTPDNYVA